jgi:ABC-type molybdate transport system substrate-binding protein
MSSRIHRAPVTGRALRVTAFLSMAFSVAMPAAQAAELQVPVSIALRGPVAEVAAACEKESGHTVRMTVAAPGEIVAALQPFRLSPARSPQQAAR